MYTTKFQNETYVSPEQKAQVELNRIVNLFSSGQELVAVYKKAFLMGNSKPSAKWSINNKIIMLTHETEDARTFLQWKDAGRYVKKGSKGFWILAPRTVRTEIVNKETGEKEKKVFMKGFTISKSAEFRIEDTEGKPIEYVQEPKEYPHLFERAKELGCTMKYDLSERGEFGSYNPSTNEIILCTAEESTFFHELAHHAQKLIDGKLELSQNTEQEAIAELTAAVLSSMYGRNYDAMTYEYIKHYSETKTPDEVGRICTKVFSKVEKILNKILGIEEQKKETDE